MLETQKKLKEAQEKMQQVQDSGPRAGISLMLGF